MIALHGVSVQKPEPVPVDKSRIEPIVPVKNKPAADLKKAVPERSDGPPADRIAGEKLPDRAEARKNVRFDQLSEQEKERLQEELDRHNAKFAYTGKYLKFKFDEEMSMLYVEVIDASTNEVIVSLPPEFLIDLSIKMKKILGLYIDEKL